MTLPTLTYIVSGTRAEFDNYLRQKKEAGANLGMCVFVDGPYVFRGRRDVHGFYIGTYEKRADIEDIREAIHIANYKHTVNIHSTPMSAGASEWLSGLVASGVILDELADIKKI